MSKIATNVENCHKCRKKIATNVEKISFSCAQNRIGRDFIPSSFEIPGEIYIYVRVGGFVSEASRVAIQLHVV